MKITPSPYNKDQSRPGPLANYVMRTIEHWADDPSFSSFEYLTYTPTAGRVSLALDQAVKLPLAAWRDARDLAQWVDAYDDETLDKPGYARRF